MAVNVPINFLANVDGAAQEFTKLTSILKAVAGAFAVKKLIDGIESVANAAAESEKATFAMAQSLRLAGDFSQQNVNAFEALAEQIQATTKYDDDLVLSQIAVAKQFGATNKEAEKLVLAATDLAAATGLDLPSATSLLGKSLDGTAGKLSELIPGVRSLTAEQLAAGGAVELVARRFKGAAEGELQTYSGVVTQLQNNMGNLVESIGDVIVKNDAVKEAIKGASAVFKLFKDIVDENKNEFRDFVAGGILFAVNSFGVFIESLRVIDKVLTFISIGLKTLANDAVAVGKFFVNIAKGDFAKAFKVDQEAIDDFNKSVGESSDALEKRNEVYDRVSSAIASVAIKTSDAADAQKKLGDEVANTSRKLDDQAPKQKRISTEILNAYAALKKQADEFGLTQQEIVEKRIERELKAIREVAANDVSRKEEALALIGKLDAKYSKERQEARLQDIQKEVGELQKIAQNPISFAFKIKDTDFNKLGLAKDIREAIAAGVGGFAEILNGKAGAQKLLSGFAEKMGQAFLGVPGIGSLFDALSKGPDAVRQMVVEFAQAVPDIIAAVLDSLPVVIDAIAENLDELVIRLVDKLGARAPDIAFAIAKAVSITLPLAVAKAVAGLVSGAFEAVGKWISGAAEVVGRWVDGAGQFVGRILDGAVQFIGKILEGAAQFVGRLIEEIGKGVGNLGGLLPGGGGGGIGGAITGGTVGSIIAGPVGGFIGAIGGGFRFAKGGTVPEGFPNDSYPASLTSGEVVIPRDDVSKLRSFLNKQESSQSQNMTVNISVGEDQLAKVLLNLNRRGFRTA